MEQPYPCCVRRSGSPLDRFSRDPPFQPVNKLSAGMQPGMQPHVPRVAAARAGDSKNPRHESPKHKGVGMQSAFALRRQSRAGANKDGRTGEMEEEEEEEEEEGIRMGMGMGGYGDGSEEDEAMLMSVEYG